MIDVDTKEPDRAERDDRMSLSLSDMRLPRGRLLVIENVVEVEIVKREMDAEGNWK